MISSRTNAATSGRSRRVVSDSALATTPGATAAVPLLPQRRGPVALGLAPASAGSRTAPSSASADPGPGAGRREPGRRGCPSSARPLGRVDPELVEDRGEVLGVGLDADPVGDRRAARAGGVDPDHPEPLGQRVGLGLVEVRRPAQAVHEQDRRALSVDLDRQCLPLTFTSLPRRWWRCRRPSPMRLRWRPEPGDRDLDDVAADHELRRVEPDPDPGRGAGGDDVAGQQRDARARSSRSAPGCRRSGP